jgi:hypothetical protein
MDDLLNRDMADAIAATDISKADKEVISKILFIERKNKNRDWDDDDAVDFIISVLQLPDDDK